MRKLKKITIFCVLIILSFILPQFAFGIGMMTKPIVIENILRGQRVTEILNLFNSEDKEVIYQLKSEGKIAGWTSFYKIDDKNLENPITEIQIPAKSRLDAIVKFKVPQDAPNGEYFGEVALMTIPPTEKEKEGVSASVLQRVTREVFITVTDKEIIKFETTIIPAKYGVITGEPLKIKVIYENEGNVSIKSDIQLKITQIGTGNIVHNAIYPYPENENPVKPFERKEFPNLIEWQTAGQKGGTYKAEITVLLNNQIIKQEDFSFVIGYKSNLFLAAISRIGNGDLVVGWFVSAGFLLMLAVILRSINKKRSSLNTKINNINKNNQL